MLVMFIGDIVGNPGRKALKELLPKLKRKYDPHFIIANGENAAGGKGLTRSIAAELFELGIHGLTMGNHTWDQKEIFEFIDSETRIVRPANYPEGVPGRGMVFLKRGGKELAIMNLQGRTFLPPLDDPFRKADDLIDQASSRTRCILLDLHAEATSEKIAMGWYVDGRVSVLVGTHTHVQTNDETILPGGTAYITDVGMTGPRDSVLGMDTETVLQKFMIQLPVRFKVAEGIWVFHAVLIDIDESNGKAKSIIKIRLSENDVLFD